LSWFPPDGTEPAESSLYLDVERETPGSTGLAFFIPNAVRNPYACLEALSPEGLGS